MSAGMKKFAVLMSCHNRVTKTLRCLEGLIEDLADSPDWIVDVFLTDDGSADGTGDEVSSHYPQVTLIRGDGSLFWAGGMRAAWGAADHKGPYDFYVWVNDDVEFLPGAVKAAFSRALQDDQRPIVLVGSILDPSTQEVTYSGVKRLSPLLRPLRFERINPMGRETECETFNGNFVIIPAAVVKVVGGMNPAYVHAYGDYDYGFRARRAGFEIRILAQPVGYCSRNAWVDPAKIRSMTMRDRWRRMTSPKLYPIPGWLAYSRAHTGPLWPVFFLRPYWEVLFPWAFSRLR